MSRGPTQRDQTDITDAGGNPVPFRKSAFGQIGNIRFASIADGTSNTVFMGEILQGQQYDLRGVSWRSDAGGSRFMSRFTPNRPIDSATVAPSRASAAITAAA